MMSAKEKRLLKLYDLTLSERGIMEKEQESKCKICGAVPEIGKILYVDHSHKVEKWKIKYRKEDIVGAWGSFVEESENFWALGQTKKTARESLKKQLRRASVRGLLCFRCNIALGKLTRLGRENATWLKSAAKYLEDHNAKINNTTK